MNEQLRLGLWATLTDAERGYVAGIIDGEGTISFMMRKRGRAAWAVVVSSTTPELIIWLKEHLGGSTARHEQKRPEKQRPLFRWSLYGGAAVELCRVIEPLLVVKRAHAQALIASRELLQRGAPGHQIPPHLVAQRAEAHRQFRVLNRRGA